MATNNAYHARNRTRDEIRCHGAISSLNDGVEITTHGIATRVIAWPGNGFTTLSVHVLTHQTGDETPLYAYGMAEEALLCLQGSGEVFLRGQWVGLEPGDVAYLPAGVEHATRNPRGNEQHFVLVSALAPPPFDLYGPAGFYNREHGVMNYDAIAEATQATPPGTLVPQGPLRYRESHPEVRAWNLSLEEIRRGGALFNVCAGAPFTGLLGTVQPGEAAPSEVFMVLNLWPGYGVQKAGFHYALMPPEHLTLVHSHPATDECLILWDGKGQLYCGDRWVDANPFDCVLAPAGVLHTIAGSRTPTDRLSYGGGFASAPQLDLYLKTPYYADGIFTRPPFATLGQPLAADGPPSTQEKVRASP